MYFISLLEINPIPILNYFLLDIANRKGSTFLNIYFLIVNSTTQNLQHLLNLYKFSKLMFVSLTNGFLLINSLIPFLHVYQSFLLF